MMELFDIGPGNCLIDEWIKIIQKINMIKWRNSKSSGKVNELILNQAIDNFNSSN